MKAIGSIAVAAIAAAAACGDDEREVVYVDNGIEVDAVYDPEIDFEQYETFAIQRSEAMLSGLDAAQRDDLESINELMSENLE